MKFETLLVFAALVFAGVSAAAEFHVSPTGSAEGDGSKENPWDLDTALAHPDTVKPGDTIWLHGGVYRGSFESTLAGSAEAPIVVRQAPGERATISVELVENRRPGLYLLGEHARFQGFEVRCENPKRETQTSGSWPQDLRRGSVEIRGNHIEAVNLIVHDLGSGFGFWSEAEGGEIYGCLIFNNGWIGPDRGHGHAIYTQNEKGTKKITETMMFHQFGSGIHLYGSEKSVLRNFEIEGVAAFDNGFRGGGRNLLIGGSAPLDGIVFREGFTWGAGGSIQVGYGADPENGTVSLLDNYFGGPVRLQYPGKFEVRGNTIAADAALIQIQLKGGKDVSGLTFAQNRFHKTAKEWKAFAIYSPDGNRSGGFELLEETGLAADSTFSAAAPEKNVVFVRPNRFERGRGHVFIYNWEQLPEVEVDLKTILNKGDEFRVVHARDFFGEPVYRGTYDNQPIAIPMSPRKAVPPIGLESENLETQLEFGAFVILLEE